MTHRIEQFKAKVKLKQSTNKRKFITISVRLWTSYVWQNYSYRKRM